LLGSGKARPIVQAKYKEGKLAVCLWLFGFRIIGGAIIPLWQRFKTHEEARLRVVRVTTDDGIHKCWIRTLGATFGHFAR
jgi:hypothetical protein